MATIPLSTSGQATELARPIIHNQVVRAGVHLQRYGEKHGKNTADYRKRAKALEAAKNFYKGLLGDEKPAFEVRRG